MEDAIVVENNGIGFNIRVPATVISEFCVTGEQVKVYTYLQIREDAHSLYGFLTRDDLEIFKMLINVNGIGPKGALALSIIFAAIAALSVNGNRSIVSPSV